MDNPTAQPYLYKTTEKRSEPGYNHAWFFNEYAAWRRQVLF